MKIAVFHELHSGGARRAVNEFAKALKKNFIVDLYIVDTQENKAEKNYFHNIYNYNFTPKKWSGRNWKIKLYKDTFELYKLYKLHKKIANDINSKGYDVAFIHPSQYTQAPFILRFIKTKKIYYCEEPLRMVYDHIFNLGLEVESIKKLYEKIIRSIRKKIDNENIKQAHIILANSYYTKQNIKQAYGLESTVSHLGVDTHTFRPSNVKKEIDIMFIGSMDNVDGYSLLNESIQLMKKKPTVKFHITGKDWISDDKEFTNLYSKARIVVCLARHEPFGLIALEAMASSVPVIAINEGGYKETVIDGQTGYLVPKDPKAIAEKLEYLLSHEQTRSNMGRDARHNIEKKWTWDKSVREIENILKMIKR